jgi:hypothetical protein
MSFFKDIKDTVKAKEKQEKEVIESTNKREKLVFIFAKEKRLSIEYVLERTGIKNEHALRTYICNLKKDRIISLRSKFGYVEKTEDM